MKNKFFGKRRSQAMVEYAVLTAWVSVGLIALLSFSNWSPILKQFASELMNNISLPIP